MKTKTTYPVNAKRAKAILVAALILIQASLIANNSSDANQNYNETSSVYSEYTEIPSTLNAENAYSYTNEEAFEAEYKIEDWMCNIHNDVWNEDAIEEEPELEEWMYNPQNIIWLDLNEATEMELAIESWMTNPNEWENSDDELMFTSK